MRNLSEAFDLSGRVAIVTGGGSGIGAASARLLADAGGAVIVGDIREDKAREVAHDIQSEKGNALGQAVDVRQKSQVDALVDRAMKEFGQLDVMVNNAGIPIDCPLTETSEELLENGLAVKAKGTFFGCQAAMRVMIPRRSGSIVNVSSGSIDNPYAGSTVYAMSNAASAMLTRTLAVEAGPYGIRVNAIAPGLTLTPFVERRQVDAEGRPDPEGFAAFISTLRDQSPLGLVGAPEDQAYLILYLASDVSRFMTGTILRANGGIVLPW